MTLEKKDIGHRDNIWRKFQNGIAWAIPGIIGGLDKIGVFPGTKIHTALANGEKLKADDITLSQLQKTANMCKIIEENKPFRSFPFEYLLTSLLNGADGPVARRMKTTSEAGGIKDAAVDRLSEVMIARLIAREMRLSAEDTYELQVSFQLSTLTKAACEMNNVKTSENGLGGMIQRRIILFNILRDLMSLKKTPELDVASKNKLEKKIKNRIKILSKSSFKRAQERIDAIELPLQLYNRKSFSNDSLNDENSTSAKEARKYAGIVWVNSQIGIDILDELNKLTHWKVYFPSIDTLKKDHQYIGRTLESVQGFLDEALKIAGF